MSRIVARGCDKVSRIEVRGYDKVSRIHIRPLLISVKLSQSCEELVIDAKTVQPFRAIPGPPGLPYIGSLLEYRLGKYSLGIEDLMGSFH